MWRTNVLIQLLINVRVKDDFDDNDIDPLTSAVSNLEYDGFTVEFANSYEIKGDLKDA
jgi:hypothetical protein